MTAVNRSYNTVVEAVAAASTAPLEVVRRRGRRAAAVEAHERTREQLRCPVLLVDFKPMGGAARHSLRLQLLRRHLGPCLGQPPAHAAHQQQAGTSSSPWSRSTATATTAAVPAAAAGADVRELMRMEGQVCIVTGGGTHLGTAMATALAQMGAQVVIASRRSELCEEVAARLRRG